MRDNQPINIPLRKKPRSSSLFSIWVVVGALGLACLLVAVTISILFMIRSRGEVPQSTAILKIIAAVTLSPTPDLSLQTPEMPSGDLPTPAPGEIQLNSLVQVAGTGGDGLRLREQPGINATIRIVASEAEVFKVSDGPMSADGYTWWYLVGPYDETRQGWAVANYLGVVQGP